MGTTLFSANELIDFFDLPEAVMPVTTLVVGWPAEDPPKRDRLPITGLLHHETYRRPDAAEIDAVFSERELKGWQRYMESPRLREAIEAAGIKTLAEFYTSPLKYDPDFLAGRSVALHAALERQGFLPVRPPGDAA